MFLIYVALMRVGPVKQNLPKRKKLERGDLSGSKREREREDWTGLAWTGLDGLLYMSIIAPYRMKKTHNKNKNKNKTNKEKLKQNKKTKNKRETDTQTHRHTDRQTDRKTETERKHLEISSPSHTGEARKAIFRPILGAKGRVTFDRETEEPVVSKDRIAFFSTSLHRKL